MSMILCVTKQHVQC